MNRKCVLVLWNRKESSSTGPSKFEVQIVAQFDNHNSQVWRVSWNITSTLLASSGDDGCVRLWKGKKLVHLQQEHRRLPSVGNRLQCSDRFLIFLRWVHD